MRSISIVLSLLAALGGCDAERAQPALSAGEQAYQVCLTCHAADAQNRPSGPNLYDLFGRRAGTMDGYFFSEPLKRSGILWDEATLDAFIANPQSRVPGTFMLVGVPDAAQRKAVIDYLRTLRTQTSVTSSRGSAAN
jgi:cytochrome c